MKKTFTDLTTEMRMGGKVRNHHNYLNFSFYRNQFLIIPNRDGFEPRLELEFDPDFRLEVNKLKARAFFSFTPKLIT